MTVFEEFKRRGLIAQCTDEEKVKELFNVELKREIKLIGEF